MYKFISKRKSERHTLLKQIVVSFLLLISVQTAVAQNHTVRITQNNPTVDTALKSIESQTGVRFYYDDSFEIDRIVNLPQTEVPLSQMMDAILKGTGRAYSIRDNFISILPAKRETSAPTPRQTVVEKSVPVAKDGSEPVKSEAEMGVVVPTVSYQVYQDPEPIVIPEPVGNYPTVRNLMGVPRFAVKTNLLYDATASIALGFELRTSYRTTLDLSGGWRLFDISYPKLTKDGRFRHWFVQPEFRLWTCEAFNGHFFGLHAHYAKFNIGGLPRPIFSETMNLYRFQGWLAGAGVSYGYHWILGKRWGLEATVGVGYAYMKYDKYPCRECGTKIESKTKHYFGPTKVGLSLVFAIK